MNSGLDEQVRTGRVGVLRERNFLLFFIGYGTSLIGTGMVPVAFTFALLGEGRSPVDIGYVLAAQAAPFVVLLLIGGVVGDRLPRRTVMITADMLRTASQAVLAVLIITGRPSMVTFMLLAAMLGVGQAFFNPALSALMPQVTSSANLQQANALKGIAYSVGQMIGPGFAGVLTAVGGPGWAVAFDAASYAVSVLCLSLMRLPRQPAISRAPLLVQLRVGWHEFSSRTWLWSIVVQFGLYRMLVYPPFAVLGAVIARKAFGGAAGWGTVLSAQGVGSIIGGLAIQRLDFRRPLVAATSATFAFAPTVALVAFHAPLWIVAAASGVTGIGVAVFVTLWETTLQREIPPASLSRVAAYDWLGSYALAPLGYALVGLVAGPLGSDRTLWLASCFSIASTMTVLMIPGVRQIRAPQPSESEPGPPTTVRLVPATLRGRLPLSSPSIQARLWLWHIP